MLSLNWIGMVCGRRDNHSAMLRACHLGDYEAVLAFVSRKFRICTQLYSDDYSQPVCTYVRLSSQSSKGHVDIDVKPNSKPFKENLVFTSVLAQFFISVIKC